MRKASACITAAALALVFTAACGVRAQEGSCTLGKVKERVAPQYPSMLNGRAIQGTVEVMATFAPHGHVSSSKVLAGPRELRLESQAYINGWRAEPSDTQRQCAITLEYQFDSSRGICGPRKDTSIRAERIDDTHVIMHLSCDIW